MVSFAFALAQTSVGKRCLGTLIAEVLSAKLDTEVTIGKITGIVPFSMHVNHFAVADSHNTEWLTIEDATLSWSPRHLFRGHFHIDELSAATVRLKSLPQKEHKRKPDSAGLLTLPTHLPPITMDRFLVGRLVLERQVIGKSAELTLNGRLSESKSFSRLEGLLRAARIDGQKGQASVALVYHSLDVPTLSINGSIDEDANGILLSLLNLETKPPFSLEINLKGSLTECKGNATVTVTDYGYCKAAITLGKDAGGVSVAARGSLNIKSSALAEKFRPLLSGDSRFLFSIGYKPEELLSLDYFRLKTDNGRLSVSASVSIPEQRLQGDFQFKLEDLSCLRGLIQLPCSGKLVAYGSLSESWHNPAASFKVLLEEAQIADLRLSRFDGDIQAAFSGSPLVSFPGLRLRGKGTADDLSAPGFDAFHNKKLAWTISADVSAGGTTVAFENCRVTDQNISLTVTGTFDPDSEDVTALADVAVVNCGNLFSKPGFDFAGANALKASIKGNIRSRSLTSQIEGELKNLHVNNAYIAALLGSKVHYSGHATVSEASRLTFTDVRIGAAAALAAGDCTYSIPENSIKGTWQVQLPSLSFLSLPAGRTVSGSVGLDGEISGDLSRMKVTTRLTGRNMVWGDNVFENLTINGSAEGLPREVRGTVQIDTVHSDNKLHAATNFMYSDMQLSLTGFSCTAPEASITGNLGFDLEKKLVEGTIEARSDDLHALAFLTSKSMHGSARLSARLIKGVLGQDLSLDVSGENLATGFGQAREFVVKSLLNDIFDSISGSGELSVSGLQKGNLQLETVVLTGAGDKQTWNFTGTTHGQYLEELALNVQGAVTLLPEVRRLDIVKFDGNYGGFPFAFGQPASIVKADRDFLFEHFLVQIGSGSLSAAGAYRDQELDLTAAVEELPLQVLQVLGTPEVSGTLSGSLHAAGRLEDPEAQLSLKVSNARIGGKRFRDVPPAAITAEANIADGWFQASGVFQSRAEKPLMANFSIPVRFSFAPPTLEAPENGAIQGKITGDINLSYLPAVLYLEDQVITGLTSVDLTLSGDISSPEIKGRAVVNNASYENANTGTILKNIKLDIQADNEKIVLQKCHANDGNKGTMSAQGWLNLDRKKQFPFQADLDFEKATLLRQDAATANVSGKLKFSGFSGKMALDGGLTVNGAEILISERLPPEVTELEVIEINKPGGGQQPASSPKSNYAERLSLDLTVGSPGRVYLRGRGLDAELKGARSLGGKLSEPAVKGDLSLVRGYFTLFDKRFSLVSGSLSYGGSIPPSPTLEVRAERTEGDFTARVRLSGKLSAPQVILESDPPLPSDEIVSRVLFGRSASGITPVQGLQVAQALESLSGRNFGVPDIVSRTRKILRVDRLNVGQSGEEDEGVSVSVGKYLKEGVYVELEKGSGTETDQVLVEIDITPNISVESEVGADAQGGIGLNWKRDY